MTCFVWDAFTLDLYRGERMWFRPILNVDTNREGQRFEIPAEGEAALPARWPGGLSTKGRN